MLLRIVCLSGAFLALLSTPHAAELESDLDKVAYGLGRDMGMRFKEYGVDVDLNVLMQGFKDGMEGKTDGISKEELAKAYSRFERGINLQKNRRFLEKNGRRPEVKTTASGLQYEIVKSGDGASPRVDSQVVTHYRGELLDGRVFDSSYARGQPARFPVNAVIKGWTEALQMMKEGDKWILFIPPELGYGVRGSPPKIPPHSLLIFQIELIAVN